MPFSIENSTIILMENANVLKVVHTQVTKNTVLKSVSLKISTTVQFIQIEILNFFLKIVHLLEYQIHQVMVVQFTLKMVKLFTTEFVHSTVMHLTLGNIALVKHHVDHSKIMLLKVLYQDLLQIQLDLHQYTLCMELNS